MSKKYKTYAEIQASIKERIESDFDYYDTDDVCVIHVKLVNPIPEISAEAFENWKPVEKPAVDPKPHRQPRIYSFIRDREQVMQELTELRLLSYKPQSRAQLKAIKREIRIRVKCLRDRTAFKLYQRQLIERELENRIKEKENES